MRWIVALSVVGFLLMGANAMAGTTAPHEPDMVTDTCSVCHGNNGISPTAWFPDLAAQTKTYLDNQLKNFRDHKRADPYAKSYMWSMAGSLSNKTISQIADYFSALQPPKGSTGGDPTRIAAGKAIFKHGVTSENVLPCEACHGPTAAGSGMFPRLAGQHREYIVAQLKAFRSNARKNATMHAVVGHMTNKQMHDIAAYLSSL